VINRIKRIPQFSAQLCFFFRQDWAILPENVPSSGYREFSIVTCSRSNGLSCAGVLASFDEVFERGNQFGGEQVLQKVLVDFYPKSPKGLHLINLVGKIGVLRKRHGYFCDASAQECELGTDAFFTMTTVHLFASARPTNRQVILDEGVASVLAQFSGSPQVGTEVIDLEFIIRPKGIQEGTGTPRLKVGLRIGCRYDQPINFGV